jgi:hypothetical protein
MSVNLTVGNVIKKIDYKQSEFLLGYIPETDNLEHFGHKKGLLIKEESLKKPQKTELIRVRGTFLDSLVTKFFSELQEKTSLPTRVK